MALVIAVLAVGVGSGTAWSNDVPAEDTTTTSPSTTSSTTAPASTPTSSSSTTSSTAATSSTLPVPATASPELAPLARGVGDSVFRSAQTEALAALKPEYRPWFVSELGPSIYEMQDEAEQMISKGPAVFVIGLGNPDVERMRSAFGRFVVFSWAVDMLDAAANVPCVLWINLKQRGVNPYYSQSWQRDATAFNDWLRNQTGGRANFHVIDWNTAASLHPGWFLADGLHLNQTGQNGYAAKIDRVVTRVC